MADISLVIDKQVFKAKKEVLCEHSDYFRAMFSGNYIENEKQEIAIDVVDAESMKIILQYMNIGLIDLTEYSLSTIGDLIIAVNFLQITELLKQIEYTLDIQMTPSNCLEIMIIAQNSGFTKLEQLAATCALLSFKRMKPEFTPNLSKLCWYLSHPYLDVSTELDVFNFGHQWLLQNETGGDALLIVLGCLDITKLTLTDLTAIKSCMSAYPNSLAAKVVDCLHQMATLKFDLSVATIQSQELMLVEEYTERVCNEVKNLLKDSKSRLLEYKPVVPVWSLTCHSMYTFSEKHGFVHWLDVMEKNVWGWSVVAWGPTKLVVVGGECSRGTGVFIKDVKMYDTLRKEWTNHGVQLPPRRHAGVAVLDDSLFLVGGVGAYRVILDSAGVYDLKQCSYRKIASFPDAIQGPAVCVHEGSVYAAGHRQIYKYEDLGDKDSWSAVTGADVRLNCIVSFKGYIYCVQSYFSHLYRFKPGVDRKMEKIASFTNPPLAVFNLDYLRHHHAHVPHHLSMPHHPHMDAQDPHSDCNSTEMPYDGVQPTSSTLTPMHLRKAKLMFFWVRYPSSAVLKMYFPDIKFNKNNTAQLVKWFSNFREFYYIQMEKYARQAISEGLKTAEDIHVAGDSELYRVLNLHYNRNNHIEVPSNFRYVVEQTLREFFRAIQGGKDTEQSWKKSIYKVISRMDDPVPEYFKSPNFLEQLE